MLYYLYPIEVLCKLSTGIRDKSSSGVGGKSCFNVYADL